MKNIFIRLLQLFGFCKNVPAPTRFRLPSLNQSDPLITDRDLITQTKSRVFNLMKSSDCFQGTSIGPVDSGWRLEIYLIATPTPEEEVLLLDCIGNASVAFHALEPLEDTTFQKVAL